MVVVAHIATEPPWAGIYSVFGFYMLSGFLMTKILHEVYGLDWRGIRRFALNRALRIYPAYWCAVVVALGLVTFVPGGPVAINHPFLRAPSSPAVWFSNLALFGLTADVPARLVPPAWSLNVELCFYAAFPLLCRWRRGVVLWFAASVAYTGYLVYADRPFIVERYTPLAAASLPFSIGAVLWHFRERMPRISAGYLGCVFVAYLVNLVGARGWGDPYLLGFYLSLVLSAVLVVGLSQRSTAVSRLRSLDDMLGRLSYPMFLLHWHVAACIAAGVIAIGTPMTRAALFWVGLLPLNLVAFAVDRFVEYPVKHVRDRVRGAGTSSTVASPNLMLNLEPTAPSRYQPRGVGKSPPMNAIEVRNLHKAFRLPHERQTTLTERMLTLFRPVTYERFEALRGVDLDVEPGEFIGIIGRNGSGKSTLLKVIAGLLLPDVGTVHVRGRATALLELGLGFSQELTVRENVQLYAAVLGYPRRDVARRIDEVIEFAGLPRFRDAKLKSLSTGMRMRLGFATALQGQSDILLLDEILAVGDADFQEKCLQVFADLKRERRTIVLVTHDLSAVQRLCTRAAWIDEGKVAAIGDSDRVVTQYLESVQPAALPQAVIAGDAARFGDGRIRYVDGWIEDGAGGRVSQVRSGDRPSVVLLAEVTEETDEAVFGIVIMDKVHSLIYATNTLRLAISTGTLRAGQTVEVRVPFTAALRNGRYRVHPAVADRNATVFHDWVNDFLHFEVTGSTCRDGLADLHADFGFRLLPERDAARQSERRYAR